MADMTSEVTPNFTWSDEELFKWHGTELVIIPFMMVIGIVGNLFVFYVYHFRWRSDTVTLVKRMLAVLDLAILIIAMPFVLYLTIYPRSKAFIPLCSFSSFVALTSASVSGIVLLIIAVDRFLKLCLLRKRGVTSTLAKKLFVASGALSILVNIPTCWLFGHDDTYFYHYNVQASYCFIDDNKNEALFVVWSIIIGLVFMVNTNVLVILYSKIIMTLRELSKKREELKRRPSMAAGSDLLQKEKQTQVMRQTAIVFIAVTVVYFVSYAPYLATLVMSMANPSIVGGMGPKLKAVYDLCKLAPLTNNMANPFIYSFTSDRFRAEVKKLVTLKSFKKGIFRRRAFSTSAKSMDQEISQISESAPSN